MNSTTISAFLFEEIGENILFNESSGIASKQWLGGLSKYTQSNCQVTLTDDGYRIYRTPNVNPTDNGNTMWGGFVIDNSNNRFGLVQGNTYVIEFDIKGQTSNAVADIWWSNLVGWGGGGLSPSPTGVVIANPVTSNWQLSEYLHFSYKWTCDSIYKTCTSAYYNYVLGETYLSYQGFKFGWAYTNTDSLGTDVYIKNLRMYNITNILNPLKISKNGIQFLDIVEGIEPVLFCSTGSIECNQLIEI